MIKFTGNSNDVIYAGMINYKSIYNNYQPQFSNAPIFINCCGDKNWSAFLTINYDSNNINSEIEVIGIRDSVNINDINIYAYNDKENYRILIGVKYNGTVYMDGINLTAITPHKRTDGLLIERFSKIRTRNVNINQVNALYGAKSITVPFNQTNCCGIIIYTDSAYSTVKIGAFFSASDSVITSSNDFTATRNNNNVVITFQNNVGFEVVLFA